MSPAGGSSWNSTRRNDSAVDAVVAAVVVERAHPQPFRAQQFEVHVGDRAPLPLGKTLGLREAARRSPRSSSGRPRPGRWWIRPLPPRRRRRRPGSATTRSAPAGAVLGAPDRDRAAGQVGQHRRARQRRLRARRDGTNMSSQISTCSTKPGRSAAANSRSGPNGTVGAADPDRAAHGRRPRPPAGARRTPGTSAGTTSERRRAPCRGGSRRRCCRSGADDAAVRRRPAPAADRRRPRRPRPAPPRRRRAVRPAAGCPRSNSRTASAPGRPPARRVVVAGAGQPQHRLRVRRRVGDRRVMGARGHPHEPVPVGAIEVHHPLLSPVKSQDPVTGYIRAGHRACESA